MLRAEITGRNQPLRVVEAPVYEAPPEGVLVKTSYAGLCHTDLHFIMADDVLSQRVDTLGDSYAGVTPGHEVSGVIMGFGSQARPEDYGLSIGDRVCVFPWLGCEECEICLAGNSHMCEYNRLGTTEMGQGLKPGGFATHVPVVHCKYVVKVADSISMALACMLPCSVVTALNALYKAQPTVQRALDTHNRARLLVAGAGGVGLWAVQVSRMLFPSEKRLTVIAADISAEKLQTALQVGADETCLWGRHKSTEENITLTTANGERKLDAVVDFVNNPMTAAIALGSVHSGGTLVSCGLFGGTLSLHLPSLVARTLSIQGSRVASLSMLRDLVAMAEKKQLTHPPLEYFALENVNEAVEKMKTGKIAGRALFKFEA